MLAYHFRLIEVKGGYSDTEMTFCDSYAGKYNDILIRQGDSWLFTTEF